ncbi:hypothetical protein NBRC111894_3931 [Sporolactobacillus inulinus]|uniref:Protein translocase subunit SecF n=1 Tax=Sporolactobacillus inulinus TaxID=2078 RepID=A0A4Y1ZGU2_9BACL|nr:hypothetical protein NBRC111894_3931 [Sporolactobacillus inulinus]
MDQNDKMNYKHYNKFYDRLDFMKQRNLFFTISAALIILGIVSLFIFKLNLGIDFQAGHGLTCRARSRSQ